ncbi:hypothetical protein EB73_09845 [Mycobacterium sp. SWH-M3]|nr:hypothetical protein EB73_09845 [Mycobacterium sp. SWH-M3]
MTADAGGLDMRTAPATPTPGTFLRIPLGDGTFGYGRALADPYIAFYDYRTAEPSTDIAEIVDQRILFIQAVRLLPSSQWIPFGHEPLEGELTKPILRFSQNIADYRKCVIFDSEGREWPAAPEECVGLEQSAVWDSPQIEQRLLDTFMGRPNDDEIRLRVRFE